MNAAPNPAEIGDGDPQSQALLAAFRARADLSEADPQLVLTALTHASYAHEHGGEDYERLEFLGDAILQAASTLWLVEHFQKAREGELSGLRQRIVNTGSLAVVADHLGVGAVMRLGAGEDATGGRTRPTVLAGAVEALLGAVCTQFGFEVARAKMHAWFDGILCELVAGEANWKDSRSLLQERIQHRLGITPSYEVTDTQGPPHDPTFAVEVRAGEQLLGTGVGRNKREAMRAAAAQALAEGAG